MRSSSSLSKKLLKKPQKQSLRRFEAFLAAKVSQRSLAHNRSVPSARDAEPRREHSNQTRSASSQKTCDSSLGIYSHMGGKIVTLVELQGGRRSRGVRKRHRDAHRRRNSRVSQPEEVPAEVKAREEEIARGQMQGKPANIIEKIIEGKMQAFYDASLPLENQKYVRDNCYHASLISWQKKESVSANPSIRRFHSLASGSIDGKMRYTREFFLKLSGEALMGAEIWRRSGACQQIASTSKKSS